MYAHGTTLEHIYIESAMRAVSGAITHAFLHLIHIFKHPFAKDTNLHSHSFSLSIFLSLCLLFCVYLFLSLYLSVSLSLSCFTIIHYRNSIPSRFFLYFMFHNSNIFNPTAVSANISPLPLSTRHCRHFFFFFPLR